LEKKVQKCSLKCKVIERLTMQLLKRNDIRFYTIGKGVII